MTNPSRLKDKEDSPRQDSVNQKERLNKTQEGLNETIRDQRDDSIGKLKQANTTERQV